MFVIRLKTKNTVEDETQVFQRTLISEHSEGQIYKCCLFSHGSTGQFIMLIYGFLTSFFFSFTHYQIFPVVFGLSSMINNVESSNSNYVVVIVIVLRVRPQELQREKPSEEQ